MISPILLLSQVTLSSEFFTSYSSLMVQNFLPPFLTREACSDGRPERASVLRCSIAVATFQFQRMKDTNKTYTSTNNQVSFLHFFASQKTPTSSFNTSCLPADISITMHKSTTNSIPYIPGSAEQIAEL